MILKKHQPGRPCLCSSGGPASCNNCEGGFGPAAFLIELTNTNCSWTGSYVLNFYQDCEWRTDCMELPGGPINLGAQGTMTHWRLRALVGGYGSTTAVSVLIGLHDSSDCSSTAISGGALLLAKAANTYAACLDWSSTELPSVGGSFYTNCIKTSLFDRTRGYITAL